jgi:telomerase reverse transcriptase
MLGASLFSVPGMYDRLKAFRERLGPDIPKLYFVKVDVKSAFDTIPQDSVLRLMDDIISLDLYKTGKHVEVKAGTNKLVHRWQTTAAAGDDKGRFVDRVEELLGRGKKNTIFVDNVMQRKQGAEALSALLTTHIKQNLVKVGKKFYRQKQGIPQGSVLSSTLCNYFYGDLEKQHLGFLNTDECLLLRLIDDFLLITTDVEKAKRFANMMHGGLPDYGVTVNPAKTVVNFDMEFDGTLVAAIGDDQKFPYCGTLIDCKTLGISKSREYAKDNGESGPLGLCNAADNVDMRNSLTVEFGRVPGQQFRRKVLGLSAIYSPIALQC